MGVGWALLFAFALGVWPLLGGAANLSPGRSLGLPGAGLISGRAGGSESPGGKGGGGDGPCLEPMPSRCSKVQDKKLREGGWW